MFGNSPLLSAGRGGGVSEMFANPFLDMAAAHSPNSFRNVLYWAEFIYSRFGTYAMAMERIISYFITDVELDNASEDEGGKWKDFLLKPLDIKTTIQSLLRDRMTYGNAFASLIVPFKRFLGCPRCGNFWTLKEVYNNPVFKFNFSASCEFVATCPGCRHGYRGKMNVLDEEDDNETRIKIKRWSPHQIEIVHNAYTDDCQYIWRIPEEDKRRVRDGKLFDLERTPKGVLEAIRDNKVYKFHDGSLFHMKEPYLAGHLNRGWGMPRILLNFGQIYYVQVLRRANEAIAQDYVIPFRILTPAARSGSGKEGGALTDPLHMFDGLDFRSQVVSMVRRRRRDPAGFNVLPFPVQYQMLGAEANQLAPRDLLDQGMETLLNDVGTPVELYKGSLQLQTAPVALRLFESTWHHLVHDANAFLSWVVEQVSQVLSWEKVQASLKRVTLADDVQEQINALQLYMSQQLSGTTALKYLGHDWKSEQKRIAEEARMQAEIQARVQEEMEQAGFAQQIAKGMPPGGPGGAPPGGPGAMPMGGPGGAPAAAGMSGGAPPGTAQQSTAGAMQAGVPMAGPVSNYLQSLGPQVPQTPQDMQAAAQQMAQELLGLPESQKDSELRKLSQANPVLHSLVRGEMDRIRRQTRSQAGNAAMAQMQQGGMPV